MQIKTNKADYKILFNEGLIINQEVVRDYPGLIEGLDFKPVARHMYSDEELRRKLSETKKIGLSLTNNCNFRCTYCPSAGMYEHENGYGNKSMSLATAKKAIDRVLLEKKKGQAFSNSEMDLSFYGGEPLMFFDLISEVVPYARNRCQQLGFKIKFSITTNGSLLTKEVATFLVENDFVVFVSIDGPKSEHDKCRVTGNQEPTWDQVMSNLRNFRSVDTQFFKRQVSCHLTIFPPVHDLDNIAEFIETDDVFKDLSAYNVNWVRQSFLRPELLQDYTEAIVKLQSHRLIQNETVTLLSRKLFLKNRQNMKEPLHLSANCFPGAAKLFVDPEGYFKVCERFPSTLSPLIGHVDTGFDLDSIRKLIEGWEDFVSRSRCAECELWLACQKCFSTALNESGGWEQCRRVEAEALIRTYIDILEERDEKTKGRRHYGNVRAFMAGLS